MRCLRRYRKFGDEGGKNGPLPAINRPGQVTDQNYYRSAQSVISAASPSGTAATASEAHVAGAKGSRPIPRPVAIQTARRRTELSRAS